MDISAISSASDAAQHFAGIAAVYTQDQASSLAALGREFHHAIQLADVATPPSPVIVTPNPIAPTPVAAPAGKTLDITPITSWLVSIASLVISGAMSLGVAWLKQHLSLMRDVTLNQLVTDSATRGAGIANAFLQAEASQYPTVNLTNTAVSLGANYVLAAFPDAIKELGASPEHIAAMVTGELGKLLSPPTSTSEHLASGGTSAPEAAAPPAEPAPAAEPVMSAPEPQPIQVSAVGGNLPPGIRPPTGPMPDFLPHLMGRAMSRPQPGGLGG